jgi:hypothetical protein
MTAVSEAHAGLASAINNATSRVASLVAVACVGILTGNAFASGLPIVSRVAALLSFVGAACGATLVRSSQRDAGSPSRRPRSRPVSTRGVQ